ncbi:MAG: twin-arginine translocation signal domain-containing protein [Planctomycetes bacterium]|nr:twin-arginine translocation signal domain-containing protein [Planctomycetota bacterium]
MNRRDFLQKTAALGAAGLSLSFAYQDESKQPGPADEEPEPRDRRAYPADKPNVILVRFGGGVRRRETIDDPANTYCPFMYHELHKRQGGLLFPRMEIESLDGVVTSHGQGTLYILTGKYDRYEDISGQPFADRFESKAPTIFEYLRRTYLIKAHEALIINGEDRINEEFYTFSNHHVYGIRYRSTVLSLYRYKTFLLRDDIANGVFQGRELEEKERELREMEQRDYRVENRARVATPEIDAFWRKWRDHYGRSGMVNPRGDRLLTTLALWAIRELKPKLMMINYQDPDYVHWGPRQFYTRAISIIDEGVREIYSAAQGDEQYRDKTVFVVVPDCGRDSNRAMPVPYQHHFNTRSAHQIFALIAGPRRLGLRAGVPVDRTQQQTFIARTIGQLMGFETPHADGQSLLR